MKYKKYILFLLLTIVFGCNKIYAYETDYCNYVNDLNNPEATAILEMHWNFAATVLHNSRGGLTAGFATVWFQNIGETSGINNREGILNWYEDFYDKATGLSLTAMYNGTIMANQNPQCPTYLIMRGKKNNSGKYTSYGAFSTNDLQTAKNFVDTSKQLDNYDAWYLVHKNTDGSEITQEEYNNAAEKILQRKVRSDDYNINLGGEDSEIDCDELFGSKNDPKSLSYLINEIMKYPRYIVPAILILLGTLDFAKAVIASKEDEMKKAQSKFIKRLIISVCIFLVPLLVNIIMSLADVVWEGLGYTSCSM